ncbi:Uncharacterised protein (plasmid) [Legionella adelaidensis]|uniref:DUF4189 domain-containing protein n=1 Tax=Legionella adelaidensis TaxID=45056 RepID=A0A0W0R498_9GAMM|nr:hypothetical protein [Legionella adelaidensis]KTC65863.1 hypothetical protein Lade_0521 [Legionella adelaidensis]VEH85293.1 Uncharacterised protein [Legionella adelaidensis]
MKYIFFIVASLFASLGFAAPSVGQWECMAFDSREKSYEATGETLHQAMQAAQSLCNRSTKEKCRVAQNFCMEGPATPQDVRCVVTDNYGRSFTGSGNNACKKALATCNNWVFHEGDDITGNTCTVSHRDQ